MSQEPRGSDDLEGDVAEGLRPPRALGRYYETPDDSEEARRADELAAQEKAQAKRARADDLQERTRRERAATTAAARQRAAERGPAALEAYEAKLAQRQEFIDKARAVRGLNLAITQAMKDGTMDPIIAIRGDLHADGDSPYAQVEIAWKNLELWSVVKRIPGIGTAMSYECIRFFGKNAATKFGKLTWEERERLAHVISLGLRRI